MLECNMFLTLIKLYGNKKKSTFRFSRIRSKIIGEGNRKIFSKEINRRCLDVGIVPAVELLVGCLVSRARQLSHGCW